MMFSFLCCEPQRVKKIGTDIKSWSVLHTGNSQGLGYGQCGSMINKSKRYLSPLVALQCQAQRAMHTLLRVKSGYTLNDK